MTEEENNIKEEDTAAVLMGKKKCSVCWGTGMLMSRGHVKQRYRCPACNGERWRRGETE